MWTGHLSDSWELVISLSIVWSPLNESEWNLKTTKGIYTTGTTLLILKSLDSSLDQFDKILNTLESFIDSVTWTTLILAVPSCNHLKVYFILCKILYPVMYTWKCGKKVKWQHYSLWHWFAIKFKIICCNLLVSNLWKSNYTEKFCCSSSFFKSSGVILEFLSKSSGQ